MSTIAELHYVVHRALHRAHASLLLQDLTGVLPRLNMHHDRQLPACVYQPNTNTVAACMPKLVEMPYSEAISAVYDAMAMCGCYRQYQLDKRVWSASQNKARLTVPALSMHGGAKWRSIRSKLKEET